MNKTKQSELIKTARLIAQYGLQDAAVKLGMTVSGTSCRVRRLEKQIGFRIFAPYDYGRVTWQGREYLRGICEVNNA